MTHIVLLRNLFRNQGDEAMLACEVDAIRGTVPSASVLVLVDEPPAAAESLRVPASYSDIVLMRPQTAPSAPNGVKKHVPQWPLTLWRRAMTAAFESPLGCAPVIPDAVLHFRKQLEAADVVIAGGGLMPSLPALSEPRHAVFRFLRRLQKPLVLSGQSLYPFGARPAPYRLATSIVLRDDCFSRHHAIAAGMRPSQLIDGVDPAFALAPAATERAHQELSNVGIAPGERFIAANLRLGDAARENVAQALRSAVASRLVDTVLLFGMQRYWATSDEPLLHSVEKQLLGVPVHLAPQWPAAVLKAVLARAQAVVACRYHAVVFALTSATPAVSFAVSSEYEWKLGGIYHQFARPEWLTTPDHVEPVLLDLLRRRDSLSHELRERERQLRPRVGRLVEVVSDLLRRGSCAG